MNNEEFKKVVNQQLAFCKSLLLKKGDEYSSQDDQDRFHSFNVASELIGCDKKKALAGMMVKHTISIYDMCQGGNYSYERWEEKITDHINYLLLLRAMIEEETNEKYSSESA